MNTGPSISQTDPDTVSTDAATSSRELERELPNAAPGKVLSPAARRALAEAALRKADLDLKTAQLTKVPELDGRGGLEPVRYNDWEIKGLTSDF